MISSNPPFVSVLLPVYNCEKYVFEAVHSILTQTYAHFELLIIDDCSTDTTLQICKSFDDDRISIIEKEKNSGYTNSLNYGISIAKGKYIARMDGDDISLPTRFEKQVTYMEANDEVVVCGTLFSIIGRDNICILPEFNANIKTRLLYGNCIGHPTVFIRRNVLIANSLIYDTQLEPAEDYDLWVRLLKFGKLHNLQECLLQYRVYNEQVSSVRNQSQIKSANRARLKILLYLNFTFAPEQKKLYSKVIDDSKKLTVTELISLIELNKALIEANDDFFNKIGFKNYLKSLELNFNNHFFKYRTPYTFGILKDYFSLYKKLNTKLTVKDLIKIVIKILINYKIE